MPDLKHIMLLIETSKVYGRALLEGIGRYAMAHGRWSVYVEERGLDDPQPPWLGRWQGDGIIFRSNTRAMVEAIRATGLPVNAARFQARSALTGSGSRRRSPNEWWVSLRPATSHRHCWSSGTSAR